MAYLELKTQMTLAQPLIKISKDSGITRPMRKWISSRRGIEVSTFFISLSSIELVKSGEVSSQIDFARSGQFNETRRDDHRVVEMYPDWKSKKVSPVRFMDTHSDIFVPLNTKVNPLRASKLRLEEKRDRPFNIISGLQEGVIWLQLISLCICQS